MDREKWETIERLLVEALDLPPAERLPFLKGVCGDDETVFNEVQSLLQVESSLGDFLENSALADLKSGVQRETLAGGQTLVPEDLRELGNFQIKRKLGRGGMGQVWLAQQINAKREVALKVIHTGLEDSDTLKRFQLEFQSMGKMKDENIAQIYEFGATLTGRPFFTMEYVDGIAITEYANAKGLGLNQRIRLFSQVCSGVTHAHRKGIIHRDLKPSNLLVAEENGRACVKIIDFGIAKILEEGATEDTVLRTHPGSFMGTPCYMSPEQLDRRSVDTLSDVYGLGAVLYELFTGVPPRESEPIGFASPPEMIQRIRDFVPEKPSSRVAALNEKGITVPVEGKRLRGELDWIVTKALEKEPGRRYASVAGLKDDLDRFLQERPVTAGPPSLSYQAFKFFKRHRWHLTVAAMATLVLLLATLFSSIGFLRARKAEAIAIKAQEEAVTNQKDSDQMVGFLEKIIGATNPHMATPIDRLSDLLPIAETWLPQTKISSHTNKARLYHVIGSSYLGITNYEKALQYFDSALQIRRQALGEYHSLTLFTLERKADVLVQLGHYPEAETLLQEVIHGTCPGPVHFQAMRGLAFLMQKQDEVAKSLALYQRVFDYQVALGLSDDPDLIPTLRGLGIGHGRLGQPEWAWFYFSWALERQEVLLGENHLFTLETLGNLGNFFFKERQLELALSFHQLAYYQLREKLDEDHSLTMNAAFNLCLTLKAQKKWHEALALCEPLVRNRQEKLGSDHRSTLAAQDLLAQCYGGLGDLEKAYAIRKNVFDYYVKRLGWSHMRTLKAANGLALANLALGRLVEARALAEKTVQTSKETLGPIHRKTLIYLSTLGQVHMEMGRLEEARVCFQTCVDQGSGGDLIPYQTLLGEVLLLMERWAQAEPYLLASLKKTEVPQDRTALHGLLQRLYQGWGKPDRYQRLKGL